MARRNYALLETAKKGSMASEQFWGHVAFSKCRGITFQCVAAIFTGALLFGCSNPYALNLVRVNHDASQKPGVIQFTDPKLYKREALINERRDELEYLQALLGNSKNAFTFEPEIVRQLELIRAFSSSVGLKFDPASAIEFQQTKGIKDLEHRIQITRLEMQLAQLERDAELMQSVLPVTALDGKEKENIH